jgi:hypothetical protein
MDWLEEIVDVITDCPANSSDLSPIEVLWAILKKLVRRMKPQTLQEEKSALLGAWSDSDEAPVLPRESRGINFQSALAGDRTTHPEELSGGESCTRAMDTGGG